MSASFPAWSNSWRSMCPTRRMGEDGYLAAKGLVALPKGDEAAQDQGAAEAPCETLRATS